MAATDARPVPRKNTAWRVYFSIRKSDGTLVTSWTGADSEESLDGGSFTDCTNEATEIGTSGCGYLDLTAAEMNADAVMIKITVTNTDALPLVMTVFPEEAGDYRADTVQVGGVSQTGGDLAALINTLDDYVDTEVAAIKAKTDNLPSDPADASDIAASFATVNTKLDTIDDFLDTEIVAIKAKTDNLPADPADASDIAASFVTVNSKLDAIDDYIDTEIAAIKAKTDNLPTDPADQSLLEAAITAATSGLATAASLSIVEGKIDTIDNFIDTEVLAIKAVTDKIDTGLVLDGAVYQFTANMLELAPAGGGGGGGTDWTANERTAIRTILGIPGSGTTPADPTDGVLFDIKSKTDQIGSANAITSLLAGAVLDPGTITSFPETLVIGDSYQETDGREIQIPLVDTDGNVLTTVGSRNLADATATFEIRRINESDPTRVITGTATIVDPPGTGTGAGAPYAVVELPADETDKGLVGYRYKGKLTLTWSGPGTDVFSFDTATIKFTY